MKSRSTLLKKLLRAASALCLVAVLATWFALGANLGWTKTSVSTQKIDEITGIEYSVQQDRFVPGLEFLAVGIGTAFAITSVTFLPIFPKSQS
jgi:hypothetical protein